MSAFTNAVHLSHRCRRIKPRCWTCSTYIDYSNNEYKSFLNMFPVKPVTYKHHFYRCNIFSAVILCSDFWSPPTEISVGGKFLIRWLLGSKNQNSSSLNSRQCLINVKIVLVYDLETFIKHKNEGFQNGNISLKKRWEYFSKSEEIKPHVNITGKHLWNGSSKT